MSNGNVSADTNVALERAIVRVAELLPVNRTEAFELVTAIAGYAIAECEERQREQGGDQGESP